MICLLIDSNIMGGKRDELTDSVHILKHDTALTQEEHRLIDAYNTRQYDAFAGGNA